MTKQVDKSHYDFTTYVTKQRWASMWHQIHEVLSIRPQNVLEIGPGPGIFKAVLCQLGIKTETLDIDPDLRPDHVASADKMPFQNNSYDVVCAFQMLEHAPYDQSLNIVSDMARVARKAIIISLPDAAKCTPIGIQIPRLGMKWIQIPRPRLWAKRHIFDGQHYWEVNKQHYPTSRIEYDFAKVSNLELSRTFRVDEFPYHRFYIFKVLDTHTT